MCEIVKQTCEVLWEVLQAEYVIAPSSKEDWKGIARQFQHNVEFSTLREIGRELQDNFSKMWNFPHCVGSYNVFIGLAKHKVCYYRSH